MFFSELKGKVKEERDQRQQEESKRVLKDKCREVV